MLKFSIICGLLASIIWRTTPTNCRHTANHTRHVNDLMLHNVQSFMDASAKPCENFYQFACGNWYQQFIDELDFGDTLGLLDHELNRKLEHLLRHAPQHNDSYAATEQPELQHEPSIIKKIRTYYKSCKKVKPYNLKKYLQLVQPSFGSSVWYIFANNQHQHQQGAARKWQAQHFDWLMAIGKLRLYGLNGVLLKEQIMPRWDESSSNSIYLDKPNLAETQPMGEGLMIELLLDIGQTKRLANEYAREITAFELQLHRLQEIEDEEGAKEMQLGYLQEYMPEINWLQFLQQIKGPSTNLSNTVIIQNIPYMRALVKLLNKSAKSTVCNYIMLKFLCFLKQQGPSEISKAECIASLRRAMPLAMSFLIGQHYYKDAELNDELIQQLFSHIKAQFEQTLQQNRLHLDATIVHLLRQKIAAMRLQIGNSPRNISSSYFDDYYEVVELNINNFYVNQLSLLRLAVEKSHSTLEPPLPDASADFGNQSFVYEHWLGSSSSPFYVKPKNLIIIPYGFLQMPVFHRNLDNIFKYAILGFSIAHELLHGFDSSGIEYDSLGNIMGPSEEIAANRKFMQGLRCMQNELATGSRSLNEKLADYEGIRLIYNSYFSQNHSSELSAAAQRRKRKNRSKIFEQLPQFSEKQLFFISFAQFFCGKVHRQSLRQSAYLEHALDELRVLQTLANYEQFSEAFGCQQKAKMHSQNPCRLW